MGDQHWELIKEALESKDAVAALLIIVSAIVGSLTPYVRKEREFGIVRYLTELITSALAGFFVFLMLSDAGIPGGTIAALSGMTGFFGTKVMASFLSIYLAKVQKETGIQQNNDDRGGRQ